MIIPTTLSNYFAKKFSLNLFFMLTALLSVVYLFDTVELLRRAEKQNDVPLTLLLQMGLLKLPEVGQTIIPFAVLFSAIFTFWQLNRRQELTVIRSAGFSAWQFLIPFLVVAVATGIFSVTVINPLGSVLLSRFDVLENNFLSQRKSYVTLFHEGLWLRQTQEGGHIILHAARAEPPDWTLHNAIVWFFDDQDNFVQRYDAATAKLESQQWVFSNVAVNAPNATSQRLASVSIPTDLTPDALQETFSSAGTIPFWRLPEFIRILDEAGFDSTKLRVHFQSLLAQPLLFAAMILLAASVSMRPPRFRGVFGLVLAGVGAGFLVFFLSSFLQALGASNQIPPVLAAWSPALVSFLLGLTVLMNLEDG